MDIPQTYEIKLKAYKDTEKGTEVLRMKYIVTNAVSCGDAEATAIKYATGEGMKDMQVLSVQTKGITEIIQNSSDRLWYVKVVEFVEDAISGKISKEASLYLAGAESAKKASDVVVESVDLAEAYEIQKISDSKVSCVISAISK